MDHKSFRENAHKMVDWMADYLENIEQYPVRAQVAPGDIFRSLPENAPENSELFSAIFKDFEQLILPGITHWQHPSFFAYFPANSSNPSILAEMLTATMGAQCMIWETSPAAAELEEKMMEWLKSMMGLPRHFSGCIQDTASTATLVALLTARERATDYQINQKGFRQQPRFRIYASAEIHSSIDKAVKIAGFGAENIVRIAVDQQFALIPEELEIAIKKDLALGYVPLCAIAATGTTSSTALDPIRPMGEICKKYGLWFHVDAAYAGTATILPEFRWMIDGVDLADSYVFNPHKWMLTNFDCTAYFVASPEALTRTFEIMPAYLKTQNDRLVNNYRDWGIQLGRRFRALKLWFVIRSYGVEGIRQKIREHVALAAFFYEQITQCPEVQIMAPNPLNLVCFRFAPKGWPEKEIDHLNENILNAINNDGLAYLTQTKLGGKYTIRAVFGQPNVQKRHVEALLELLLKTFNTEMKAVPKTTV